MGDRVVRNRVYPISWVMALKRHWRMEVRTLSFVQFIRFHYFIPNLLAFWTSDFRGLHTDTSLDTLLNLN